VQIMVDICETPAEKWTDKLGLHIHTVPVLVKLLL
jgi:hypothetical protein